MSYMALSLAQLELNRINPDEKLLGPAMKAMDFMTSNNGMSISGGAGQAEIWTNDQDGRGDLGESCATAYQLRIYDNLLRLRGDSRFGILWKGPFTMRCLELSHPTDGISVTIHHWKEDRHITTEILYCVHVITADSFLSSHKMVYYRTENGIAGQPLFTNLLPLLRSTPAFQ